MADVFYCFVAVVYHEGILIYLFSRHEKFFYSFVPSWSMLSIVFLLLFIPQSLILGTIALVFRFAVTDILYYHTFCVVETLLYFLRHFNFFKLLSHGRCCLFLDVAAVYIVGFLFIYLFSLWSI